MLAACVCAFQGGVPPVDRYLSIVQLHSRGRARSSHNDPALHRFVSQLQLGCLPEVRSHGAATMSPPSPLLPPDHPPRTRLGPHRAPPPPHPPPHPRPLPRSTGTRTTGRGRPSGATASCWRWGTPFSRWTCRGTPPRWSRTGPWHDGGDDDDDDDDALARVPL